MELLNNIGISFKGSYISQGSKIEKCKKADKLDIKNIEFVITNNGKDLNFDKIDYYYQDNIIVHLPTISTNQSNFSSIKEIIPTLKKNNINLVTIDASMLSFDTYEWSTLDEQKNYIRNISKAIATLASNNINIAIENTGLSNDGLLFGKTVSNLTDILTMSRKILVEDFEYSREESIEKIGISLNYNNLITSNELNNLKNFISVFSKDIRCIKIDKYENTLIYFNELLNLIIENNIDVPILLEFTNDIEELNNDYSKIKYLIKNKIEGKALNFNNYKSSPKTKDNEMVHFRVSEAGYTNIVIVLIILLTIFCAVLMLMVKFRR